MIEQGEISGIPAFFAARSGPARAGLVFRVGQADESLPRRGITHLVEHLALHRLGLTDYHSNGATGPTLTHFFLEGDAGDVVAFLRSVCASLGDLPLDRLPRERDILETEQAGRGRPSLPVWRYGAQGYGLTSYPEWGVERVGGEEVAAWAAEWFTRDNAALWFAGERMPAGLELALPPGTRRPPPSPSSALPATPAWYANGHGEVVLDMVVRRSAAASAFGSVLGREMFRVLRQEGGWSYTAGASYDPRDGGHAEITAYADSHPDKEDAVVGAFIELLAGMGAGRIRDESVASARERSAERFAQPDVDADIVAGWAADLLLGGRTESLDELRAEAAAVTTDDVREVARVALADALLMVPEGQKADWAGYSAAPSYSRHAVPGQSYPAIDDPEVELIVGRDGVCVRTRNGPRTVRFDHCAARLDWPDGRRVFIGEDGISVTVEPTLFRLDAEGRAGLDVRVAAARVIPRPARDRESIPQPEAAAEPVTRQAGPRMPRLQRRRRS